MADLASDGELSAAVGRLGARIERQFSSIEAEQLAMFASRLLAKGGSAYATTLSDDDLMAVVCGASRFFMGAGGFPRLRVFNPRLPTDGWEPQLTVVETCMEDNPFIVDVVRGHLRREGLAVRCLLHPVFVTRREQDGGLAAIRAHGDDGVRESFVHVAVDRIAEGAILSRIDSDLRKHLEDLHLAMRDHHRMREWIEAMAKDLEWIASLAALGSQAAEAREAAAFLRWLVEGNFLFLGYYEARVEEEPDGLALEAVPEASLGIARAQGRSPGAERWAPPGRRLIGPTVVTVAKSNAASFIFPFSPMDEVGVQRLAPDGRVLGEGRFLGVLTSKALAAESAEVPVLRRMLAQVLEAEGTPKGSHDHEEIVAVFNTFPKEALFRAATEDILDDIRAVRAAEPGRISVRTRETPAGQWERRLSVIVGVPGDKLSVEARERIESALVARTGGTLVASHLARAGAQRLCLYLTIDAPVGRVDPGGQAWESEIAAIVNTWDDQLLAHLETRYPSAEARRIASRFRTAFPAEYRAVVGIEAALGHVGWILELERSRTPQVTLANPSGGREGRFTVLHIYETDGDPVPSEIAPILNNLGLCVRAEDSLAVEPTEGLRALVHTFHVQDRRGRQLDLERVRGRFEELLLAVRTGEVEDDILNGLVVTTDLDWRAIDGLRTLCGYGYQIGLAPTIQEIHAALRENPGAAHVLVELFRARFAPGGAGDPGFAREKLVGCLGDIARPTDARVLRSLATVVEAIVRTNFFRPLRGRHPYVAIKIDGARLDLLPHPRPSCEIYVQSARMEGLHLRSTRTARGGIVQCECAHGLRSEVLARLRSQDMMNVVTVPGGASGGFVVKRTRLRDGSEEEVREAYATLVRGLLDLTDNRAGGAIRRPRGEQIYDDEDAYLVVAPESGNASLSDLARSIAAEYSFWMGDAFAACGGLPGCDAGRHRIDVQGAWECVRAHLREAGRVIEDPIVVVGTGDMKDDLFSSAMLVSPSIQLRAALSRDHIFLDPSPEPERAFAERERLARDRLGWEAYDASKLGQGGMVVPRGAKRVELSEEARSFLGLGAGEVSAEGVTRAIIRAKADVLWSGGSATYDRADGEGWVATSGEGALPIQVDGREFGAAIVAEGGPAGLSHRTRVEYALAGGRINTCAIDGAGGSDLADHEVNLKILFQPLLESGALSRLERDRVLGEVAEEVVARVLCRVRSQHRALSFDQWRSRGHLAEYREAAAWLAADPSVAPALEVLPDRHALRARRGQYLGLTRPELGVILACGKTVLKRRLLGVPALLDDPACEPFLLGCFPSRIRAEFGGPVREHWLRREIIAAELSNQVVDTSGCTFVYRIVGDADVGIPEAVRAWVIAFDVADGRDLVDRLWSDGNGRSAPTGEAELQIQGTLVAALERLTSWVLHNVPAHRAPCDVTRELRAALGDARERLPGCFSASEAEIFHRRATELEMAGLAKDVAWRLALIEWLGGALDVAAIAGEAGCSWEDVARLFYGLSGWLDFPWLLARIVESDGEDSWQHRAARGLAEDLAGARCRLVRRLCAAGATRAGPDAPGLPRARAEKVAWLITDLKNSARVSPAALQVVVRELGRLCEVG